MALSDFDYGQIHAAQEVMAIRAGVKIPQTPSGLAENSAFWRGYYSYDDSDNEVAVEARISRDDLRKMAKAYHPGDASVQRLPVREHAEYMAYRQQLGWPHSRSITGRLVKHGRINAD